MTGILVAATTGPAGVTVHASPTIHRTQRPDLGEAPWNPLCGTTWTPHRHTGPVTCRTCLAAMTRRGLTLGGSYDLA
ncbi:hypothetical protein [Streptomyces sp. WMMC897]|uniref:hypothetical protein n=1 Tax=Streptomyces sp. WMMC897 TaxID=3014782 RepID=UPI0022B62BDF|nr:hypothetical protein [Streptomyces sp. WMMC897]MCZ7413112.1 hypothetical protein [Streptomyces sp. WMMC897]MCZ7415504.1 hypothetical protein [Streptomyces sp. WMMC897]